MDYYSLSALCITTSLVVSSWACLLSIHLQYVGKTKIDNILSAKGFAKWDLF